MSEQVSVQSYRVGYCHHGFHAYAMVTHNPNEKPLTDGRWHSGPALDHRRGHGDRAQTADGIELTRCEGDPLGR